MVSRSGPHGLQDPTNNRGCGSHDVKTFYGENNDRHASTVDQTVISATTPGRTSVWRNKDTAMKPPNEAQQHIVAPSPMHKQPRLLFSSEIPKWQDPDVSYVRTGFRHATPTLVASLKSCLYLHNESINIFSHVIGAAIFLILPWIVYDSLAKRYPTAKLADVIVLAIYPVGVAICFILSATFHTLISHSPSGFQLGRQLDFQGIIVLMWAASIPLVFYTFHAEPSLQKTYWSMTTAFASFASISTFSSSFRKPGVKLLRAGMFGLLGLSTLMSVMHGLIVHGWAHQTERFPMWTVGLTALFNGIGATVYVIRFPERWWPRRFDIFGASHQLMHCAIIVAGLAWLAGTVIAFDNAHAGIAFG